MLDEPSALAVERHANSFPGKKIEMIGRKGVYVRRQAGMGRGGINGDVDNGNNNIGTSDDATGDDDDNNNGNGVSGAAVND